MHHNRRMPELPEVENIRKGLTKLKGQKILRVFVLQPQIVSGKGNLRRSSARRTGEFSEGLKGEIIKSVERRGKNLLFRTKNGKIVLAHLKMTGQFIYDPSGSVEPGKHTRIIFELSGGNLFYNDIRRFGYVLYFPNRTALKETGHFENLGLEPFDRKFTLNLFRTALKNRNSTLKSVLMNQEVVAGIGNIYADEICYAAKILPGKKASLLNKEEIKNLYRSIKSVLKQAIKLKGSSIRNYRLATGEEGGFAKMHQVYGRAGEPCFVCETKLAKSVIGNRTTVFCKNCQK